MTVMAAIQSETSSTSGESAVFETVRRVNAEALCLLMRRSEINRRIRRLHRLMHGLRHLATKNESSGDNGATQESAANQPARKKSCCGSGPREQTAIERQPLSAAGFSNPLGQLRRACRIALMEAGGSASLDEIRSRIVRRGSFSFSDSGLSESAIIQALDLMATNADVRGLEIGPQSVWQHMTPAVEIDTSE